MNQEAEARMCFQPRSPASASAASGPPIRTRLCIPSSISRSIVLSVCKPPLRSSTPAAPSATASSLHSPASWVSVCNRPLRRPLEHPLPEPAGSGAGPPATALDNRIQHSQCRLSVEGNVQSTSALQPTWNPSDARSPSGEGPGGADPHTNCPGYTSEMVMIEHPQD